MALTWCGGYPDWSIKKVKTDGNSQAEEGHSEISHAACRGKQDNSGYTVCTWPVGSRYPSLTDHMVFHQP